MIDIAAASIGGLAELPSSPLTSMRSINETPARSWSMPCSGKARSAVQPITSQ